MAAAPHVMSHFWRTTWSSRISFSVRTVLVALVPDSLIATWADNGVSNRATTTDWIRMRIGLVGAATLGAATLVAVTLVNDHVCGVKQHHQVGEDVDA
jgi:hypothetical protein